MTDWAKPQVVKPQGRFLNLPPDVVGTLLPEIKDIPGGIYPKISQSWLDLQERWFFNGLPNNTVFTCKDGIDLNAALNHLAACQQSFQPKHEHKKAGVAYLMSLWFDEVRIDDKIYK